MDKKIFDNNAVVIIIPNYSLTASCFLPHTRMEREWIWEGICELNNLDTFDPENDKLIQVWFHNNEIDNLSSEDTSITIDGKKYYYSLPEYIPAKVFENTKEMDELTIMIPVFAEYYNEEKDDIETTDIIIRLKVTACQSKYRYSFYGTFENAFAKVCSYTDRPMLKEA